MFNSITPKALQWILRTMPNFCWPLKVFLIKRSLVKVGRNFRCSPDSILTDPRFIEIGENVFFGNRTTINTVVPVKIGSNVMFGPEVMILGGDHNITEVGKLMKDVHEGGINKPVIIEDDVWIGSRVLILKGVIIGEGAVVGAGSVVIRRLPPFSVSVGHPCKPVKCRFSSIDLKTHLKSTASKYSFEDVVEEYNLWGLKI
ncbi:MAG TPA: acyltransferase [Ignavibacteria bacterium]